jgi:hypothetical protein
MVKSNKITILLLSLLVFSSCNSQEKKTIDDTVIRGGEKMKVEFNFYPSSGGDPIYTITYSDEILYVKKLEFIDEITEYKKKFTKNEDKRVKQAVLEVKKREDIETEIIADAWRMELIVDGDIFYNKSDINLKTLPADIKNLLNLLIEDSIVKIDLYGFS